MALKVGSKSSEMQLCIYDCRNRYHKCWLIVNFTKDADDFEQHDRYILERHPSPWVGVGVAVKCFKIHVVEILFQLGSSAV